jgi:hypothetical protein
MGGLGRPSLKITRPRSPNEAEAFVVEVWNPFAGSYEFADTLESGMRRVKELASLRKMWLQRHPKRNAPDVNRTDKPQWAEFRINTATYCRYDTLRFDRPSWRRETGLTHAADTRKSVTRCLTS